MINILLLAIMWATSAFSMVEIFNHQNMEHCLFSELYTDNNRGSKPQDRAPHDEELVIGLRDFFFHERNFDKAAQGIFDEIIFHIKNRNRLTLFLNRIFLPIISPDDENYIKAIIVYSRIWNMLSARLEISSDWTQIEEPSLEKDKLPLFSDLRKIY